MIVCSDVVETMLLVALLENSYGLLLGILVGSFKKKIKILKTIKHIKISLRGPIFQSKSRAKLTKDFSLPISSFYLRATLPYIFLVNFFWAPRVNTYYQFQCIT